MCVLGGNRTGRNSGNRVQLPADARKRLRLFVTDSGDVKKLSVDKHDKLKDRKKELDH
jgi:hypothetical protein